MPRGLQSCWTKRSSLRVLTTRERCVPTLNVLHTNNNNLKGLTLH